MFFFFCSTQMHFGLKLKDEYRMIDLNFSFLFPGLHLDVKLRAQHLLSESTHLLSDQKY